MHAGNTLPTVVSMDLVSGKEEISISISIPMDLVSGIEKISILRNISNLSFDQTVIFFRLLVLPLFGEKNLLCYLCSY